MSIKRIFIVISAIFAASAVFADNSSVTSKKYVDDLMSGYQGKIPGSGANTLMIYDDETGIGEKAIAATLGNSASAVSVPTVGAVKTGLDGKQDTITGTAGYVMTGTETPGEVGERAIYSANTNYTDSLVTAETVNTGVINAVNSSLIRVDANGNPDNNGLLWQISDYLLAINAKVPYGYTELEYVNMNTGSYLLTNLVPTYDSKIEIDFATTSLSSYSTVIGGRSVTTTGAGLNFGYVYNKWVVDGFSSARYSSGVQQLANTRYKFTFNNKVTTLESGGSTLLTNTFTGENANGAALAINAFNNAGSVVNNTAGVYLYSFKMWNAQGNLIANYIPATYNNTVGFYDTVSGTFKTATSGTFTAGPSCASPNLFDVNKMLVENKAIRAGNASADNPLGSEMNASNWNCTDYISVLPDTTYTYTIPYSTSAGAAGTVFYSDKSVDGAIRGITQDASLTRTFTTPPNCQYVRFSWLNSHGNDVQLELGSTATTYRPYGENICD